MPQSALSRLLLAAACLLATFPAHAQNQSHDQEEQLKAQGAVAYPLELLKAKPAWRLYFAVEGHDHAALKALLAQGEPASRPAPNHILPLSLAAQTGDLDAILLLLKAGAVINPDASFTSPLEQAVEFAQIDAAQLLLANSANVNARNVVGESVLYPALRNRNYRLLKLLLQVGADPNMANNEGDTPLMIAALDDDYQMVEFLKNAGARFRSVDEELLYAAGYGDVESLQRVLSLGAKVNNRYGRGVTPLMAAALNGQTAAVKLLIASRADLNARDGIEATPLFYAIKSLHKSTIFALIEAGADVTVHNQAGENLLTQAATYLDDPELVQLLLDHKVPFDGARSLIYYTPLMAAASFGHLETARVLLAAGAEINAQSKEGLTSLMDAGTNGNTAIISLLLQAGADPSLKSKIGKTALDYARQMHGQDSPAVLALQKEVDVQAHSPSPQL